jgi:hypothetical protein
MLDLFWNLLAICAVLFVVVVLFGGSGVDIPEEARGEE